MSLRRLTHFSTCHHVHRGWLICLTLCQLGFTQSDAAAQPTPTRSPAVAALLDGPLETPADQLNAVLTLLNFGEVEVAATVFDDLRQQDLSDQACFALIERFGTARFLALARLGEASREDGEARLPGAAEFVQKCLEAAERVATQPDRLQELVRDLTHESAAVRKAARVDLAGTGVPGIQIGLEALARAEEENTRAHLLHALTEMRPLVYPLAVAAVADGEGQFRRDTIELAGHLRLLDAIPWIATFAAGGETDPSVASAARVALEKMGFSQPDLDAAHAAVRRELQRVDAGILATPEVDGTVTWWSYDKNEQTFSQREVSPREYQQLATARLTRLFVVLPNATPLDRQQALIAAEQAAHESETPLTGEFETLAESLTVSELNAALGQALATEQTGAALALAQRLGERGDAEALLGLGSQPSPLAKAVGHSHRDLRFAALEAVMQINPQTPFPGSSRVAPALWHFASGSGTMQALAAAPVSQHASDWAGHLRGLGYEATPVFTGRDLLREVVASPRLAMVLVDSDIAHPGVREVIFQLRAHQPTASIPIGVFCSSHGMENCRRLAESDPLLLTTARPYDAGSLEEAVERLLVSTGATDSPELRTQQAERALSWLAELFERDHPYDELQRNVAVLGFTVFNPDLSEASLRALAGVNSAGSQRILLDFVNNEAQPMELRQQAVEAFQKSFERFGNHLTGRELSLQYDRYNASGGADQETQELLGKVLDILEYRE